MGHIGKNIQNYQHSAFDTGMATVYLLATYMKAQIHIFMIVLYSIIVYNRNQVSVFREPKPRYNFGIFPKPKLVFFLSKNFNFSLVVPLLGGIYIFTRLKINPDFQKLFNIC